MGSTHAKQLCRSTCYWCGWRDADTNRTHRTRERRQFRGDLARGLYD